MGGIALVCEFESQLPKIYVFESQLPKIYVFEYLCVVRGEEEATLGI